MRLRSAAIAAAAALVLGFAAGTHAADRQPHMRAALHALTTAKAQLQQAAPDTGGHREKALQLVDDAIGQVQRALRSGVRERDN